MRYEDLRQLVQEHFKTRLSGFKEMIASEGPLEDNQLEQAMRTMGLAELEFDEWLNVLYADDGTTLVDAFCAKYGIKTELTENNKRRLLREIHKANLTYSTKVLNINSSYDELDIEDRGGVQVIATATPDSSDAEPFKEIVQRHLDEGARSNLWREKTYTEKREALTLLGELTGQKPVAALTKTDARHVKSALQKLPKNRNKSPRTRNLSLSEMLELKGVPLASTRTLNGYVSAFQTFFGWAVEHGYAESNIFEGLRFKTGRHQRADKRDAFTVEQLNIIFEHLTTNPAGLVKKDTHKWVPLIAMFTGARLNEVAQLKVEDVRSVADVWCLDLTTDNSDDDGKRLKNASSKRLVPIHDTLIESGLLEFVQAQREAGHKRLFPTLTYSSQNGYGRNVGRWFNEKFLVLLEMKRPTLVFHSLRHSMNTQLAQSDVPEHLQKAILGHAQGDMSYDTYFKDGFLLSQLRPVVNKFTLAVTSKETDGTE